MVNTFEKTIGSLSIDIWESDLPHLVGKILGEDVQITPVTQEDGECHYIVKAKDGFAQPLAQLALGLGFRKQHELFGEFVTGTNLISTIKEQMATDPESECKTSGSLDFKYTIASEHEKEIINDVLISICGWSYPTLTRLNGTTEDADTGDENDDIE